MMRHRKHTTRGRGGRRGRLSEERGQSLVEFVIALPVLLVIVFGIIEFATAWRTYQIITNAAREGARVAVVASTPPDPSPTGTVQTTVRNYMTNSNLDLSKATITLTCADPGGTLVGAACDPNSQAGFSEGVRVDYQHDFVVLGPVLDLMCIGCGTSFTTVTLTSESIMRQE